MKILVINPNSTESVTVGLQKSLDPVAPAGVELGYFTAPKKAPPSSHTFHLSCLCGVYCFEELIRIGAFEEYDAFLVCCCSDHPLQHMIRDHLRSTSRKPAIGMFEAGISHCLMLGKRFGLITLGPDTIAMLGKGVSGVLGTSYSERFVPDIGAIGCDLDFLMEGDRDQLYASIRREAGILAKKGAEAVIMGCAGFAGMEPVFEAGAEEAGSGKIFVVDGAKAGVEVLHGMVRMYGSSKAATNGTNGHA